MMRHLLLAALAVIAFGSGQRLAADEPESLELWIKADISIAADGSLSALEWQGKGRHAQVVLDRLEPVVRGWHFQPGEVNGVPAETRTVLSLRVDARAMPDGAYALSVGSAGTGPVSVSDRPPDYPGDALRQGANAMVLLQIAADANGEVTTTVSDYVQDGGNKRLRKLFEAAAVEAAEQWTLHQELVGGHPVPAQLSVPITFCLNSSKWCEKQHAAMTAADRTRPSGEAVATHSVAAILSDVTGSEI